MTRPQLTNVSGIDVSAQFKTSLKVDERHHTYDLKITYEFLGPKKEIRLSCGDEFDEYHNVLPFAYDIVEMQNEPNYFISYDNKKVYYFEVYAVLRIVAGPGVHISLKGFRTRAKPSLQQPLLEIYRVQDPTMVPLQGYKINPAHYIGMDFVPEDYWDEFIRASKIPLTYNATPLNLMDHPVQIAPEPALISAAQKTVFVQGGTFFYIDKKIQPPIVTTLSNGVHFYDVTTDSHLFLTVPATGGKSDLARFVYSIEYDGYNPTVIHIQKTRDVKIQFFTLYREEIADGDSFPISATTIFEEYYEVISEKLEVRVENHGTIHTLSFQGDVFNVDSSKQINPMSEREKIAIEVSKNIVDIGVGFIPIAGDAVDLAEFVSGYDKWGRKLTLFERMITGLGVLIPVVSSGLLRSAAKGGKAL